MDWEIGIGQGVLNFLSSSISMVKIAIHWSKLLAKHQGGNFDWENSVVGKG